MSSRSPTLHLSSTPDIYPATHPAPTNPILTAHFPNPTSTYYVGVERDREGWNLPKIILTHNRVMKRDREREVWGRIYVCQNKIVQGGQTGVVPYPNAWFPQTNQETRKALGRFCFGVRLHSWPLLVRETDKSRKETVGYVIQTSRRGSVKKKIATPSHTVVILPLPLSTSPIYRDLCVSACEVTRPCVHTAGPLKGHQPSLVRVFAPLNSAFVSTQQYGVTSCISQRVVCLSSAILDSKKTSNGCHLKTVPITPSSSRMWKHF
jgi:hypothetical protein